jgi:hypothetical protein
VRRHSNVSKCASWTREGLLHGSGASATKTAKKVERGVSEVAERPLKFQNSAVALCACTNEIAVGKSKQRQYFGAYEVHEPSNQRSTISGFPRISSVDGLIS